MTIYEPEPETCTFDSGFKYEPLNIPAYRPSFLESIRLTALEWFLAALIGVCLGYLLR